MTDPRIYHTPAKRLRAIAELIEAVDDRAVYADGPVTKTRHEMTDAEMVLIYELAIGHKRTMELRRRR